MKLNKIAVAVVAAFLAPAAMAVTIPGLYNTGEGIADNALDTHYALTVTQGTTVVGANGYAADQVGFPDAEPWIGADGLSKWLTPFQDEALSLDPSSNGIYKWSLSFDLTGFNLASASISGRWAADNSGYIQLNGNNIGSIGGPLGFASWSNFSAATGFLAGINTLDFVVTNLAQNGGNPTGLRVEFLQTNVTAAAIPEPESYALLLGSLGVLGAISRRRQAK